MSLAMDEQERGWMELYYQAAAQRDAFSGMWSTYVENQRPLTFWHGLAVGGAAMTAVSSLVTALVMVAMSHWG